MDERTRELLARLGTTEKVSKELIELGEPVLDAVDAIAKDESQRMDLRRTASWIAKTIRDRALRAPRAARAAPRPTLGDAFHARHELEAFLAALREAGARRIAFEGEAIVVDLPDEPDARARLLAIYDAEVDALGEEFGGDAPETREMTPEECARLGAPAGAHVLVSLHARDTGQAQLRFWWD